MGWEGEVESKMTIRGLPGALEERVLVCTHYLEGCISSRGYRLALSNQQLPPLPTRFSRKIRREKLAIQPVGVRRFLSV